MPFFFSSKKSQNVSYNVIPFRITRVINSHTLVLICFVAVLTLLAQNRTYQKSSEKQARLLNITRDGPDKKGHQLSIFPEPYARLLNIPRDGPDKKGHQLEFVHITKTGGSAIEHAAARAGVKWGVCHFHINTVASCEEPDWIGPNHNINNIRFPKTQSYWHVPIQYFVDNPYKNSPTFAVVRNPYERYISEYYCKWGSMFGPKENKNDPKVMNAYLQRIIPLESQEHYLPQHYYVYDKGKRMIDHVLHFENLNSEFAELMDYYKLDIKLATSVNSEPHTNRLTVRDLSGETVELINRVAELDFKYFHYEMKKGMATEI